MPNQINPPVLSSKQACEYLSLNPLTDALRVARSKGVLWGVKPPEYVKIGTKIVYRKDVLDKWLASFSSYTNTAQANAI